MQGHRHSIGEEFPEYKEQIPKLKASNAHLQSLLTKWEDNDTQIARAESLIDLMSEEQEEQLRRNRLALNDEIYAMLSEAAKA